MKKEQNQVATDAIVDAIENRKIAKMPIDKGLSIALVLIKQGGSLSGIGHAIKQRIQWHLDKTEQYATGKNRDYHLYMFRELTATVRHIDNAIMALPSDFKTD